MERRSFFERYRPTNLSLDPLPLKVLNHTIWEAEMLGHVLDWASQYLHQKSCPSYLISPLLGKIVKEISKADLSDCYSKQTASMVLDMDEVDAEVVHNVSYQPLKLMQSVTSKVDDICLRYKEENDQIETDFPVETEDGSKARIFGASYFSIKNSRRTLEDRMVILPEINKVFNLKSPANYFAVFDGHNGVEAAAYSAAHLHRHLFTSPDFPSDYSAAINYAFETTDTALLMKCKDENIRSGTTAVVALTVPGSIYIAWVGDSQAVLVRNTEPINLVSPHKPDREDELRRIKSAGGEVISVGGTWRVNGNLAVSRAIGNLDYKDYVTSTPEISHIETNGSEEFLILACDGLWDVVSPQQCFETVKNSLLSKDPSDIDLVSQKLVIEAKKSGSGDNITVIVVLLKPKADLIELYSKELPEKMNGSVEAPVNPAPVKPAAVPKSPSGTSTVAPKVTSSASPVKGSPASKPTGTVNRSPLGMRNPPVSKTPVKSTERRPPTKAPVLTTKLGVAAPKTTKDGVAASAKPAPSKTTIGATSRTQLASKTATTTKKPLKTEETEKPVTTKTVVPPRPRPGTVPLSSRLTTTTKTAPKIDTNKSSDSSASTVKESTVTKRSVLNSARSTAPKEVSASSRVTQVRQPPAAANVKLRVPSATSTTARPASGTLPAKSSASSTNVTKKAATSSTTTTSTRPPIKKPLGAGPVKKEVGKVNGQPPLASKSEKKIPPIRSKAQEAAAAAKLNGAATIGEIAAKGLSTESAPQLNGVGHTEVEKQIEVEIPKEIKVIDSEETPLVVEKVNEVESLSAQQVKDEPPLVDTNENTLKLGAVSNENDLKAEETFSARQAALNEINDLHAAPAEDVELLVSAEVSEEIILKDAPIVADDVSNATNEEICAVSNGTTENQEAIKVLGTQEDQLISCPELQEEISDIPDEVNASSEFLQELTVNETSTLGGKVQDEEIIETKLEPDFKSDQETPGAPSVHIEDIGEMQLPSTNSEVITTELHNEVNVFNGEFRGYVENFIATKTTEVAENEVEAAEPAISTKVCDTLAQIADAALEMPDSDLLAEVPEPEPKEILTELGVVSQSDLHATNVELPSDEGIDVDMQPEGAENNFPGEGAAREEIEAVTTLEDGLVSHPVDNSEIDATGQQQNQVAVEPQSELSEDQSQLADDSEQPLLAEETQSELIGEQQSTLADIQQSAHAEDQQSALIDDQKSAVAEDEQSPVIEDQKPAVVEDEQSPFLDDEQSALVEDEQSPLIDDQKSALVEDEQSPRFDDEQPALVEDQQPALIQEHTPSPLDELISTIVQEAQPSIVKEQPLIMEDINFNYEQGSQGKVADQESMELIENRSSQLEENNLLIENKDEDNRDIENLLFVSKQNPDPTHEFGDEEAEQIKNSVPIFGDPSIDTAVVGDVDGPFNQPSVYPEEIESNVDEDTDEFETGVAVDSREEPRIADEQANISQDSEILETMPEVACNASSQNFSNTIDRDSDFDQNYLNESQQPLLDCSTAESNPESETPVSEKCNAIEGLEPLGDLQDGFSVKSSNQKIEIAGELDEFKFDTSDPSNWSSNEVPLSQFVSENLAKVEPSEPGVCNNPFLESREMDTEFGNHIGTGNTHFQLDVNAPEFTPSGFNFDAPNFNPSEGFQDIQGLPPGNADDLAEFDNAFGNVNLQDSSSANNIFSTNGSHPKDLDLHILTKDSANPFFNDAPFAVNGDKMSGIKNELDLGAQIPSGFQDPLDNSTSPVPVSELPPSSEVTNQGTRVDTMGSEAKDDFAIFNH